MATIDPGDEGAFPAMSPADIAELTEDLEDKQNGLKQQGSDALEDGKQDLALEKFTEAIAVGCASAMLLSRRAQLLLQMDRPRAAINDCNAALEVNPDSAKAFKIRAKGYRKLEMWKESHADFQTALKIDYDEQTYEDSLEVEAKAKEIKSAEVTERNKKADAEHYKEMQENKRKYEEGLKANEEKFREQRMAEEEEKRKAEEERKERVRKREAEEGGGDSGAAADDGVPKSHAPPEPAEPGTAEDVD